MKSRRRVNSTFFLLISSVANCREKILMSIGKMNCIAAVFFFGFFAVSSRAQHMPFDGQWEGTLQREGSEVRVSVRFTSTASGVEGTMTMPTVGMFRQPLSKISLKLPQLHFEQENLAAIFDGNLQGDQISGNLQIIGLAGKFYLKRSQDEPLPYTQEEVHFRNGD